MKEKIYDLGKSSKIASIEKGVRMNKQKSKLTPDQRRNIIISFIGLIIFIIGGSILGHWQLSMFYYFVIAMAIFGIIGLSYFKL